MPQPPDARPPTRPRPWAIPPAPRRRPNEGLPATEVLTEHEPAVAVFLWLLQRDVDVWAATPPASRANLIRRSATVARSHRSTLAPVLDAIHDLLSLITGGADRESAAQNESAAAHACARIAEWAASTAPHTALVFSLSAARLMPARSGAVARDVACRASRCGLGAFAEAWLRRAVALSRRTRDWVSYAGAFADAGDLYLDRGDHPRARTAYARGLRACRRYSVRDDVLAQLAVGRFRIAAADRDLTCLDRFQRVALRAGKTNGPAIRRALAAALIGHGLHGRAISLLLPAIADEAPLDRLATARLLGRAAHAAGERDVLARAWLLARASIDEMPHAERERLIREFSRDVNATSA